MSREHLDELLGQASAMDRAPAKVALLEEAVRECDTLGDAELAFDVRQELISEATHCGYYEKALVAFTWCLAEYDRNPTVCHPYRLLWQYKWIAGHLPRFVEVSREQITSMQDDMERRYQQMGFSLRPVEMQRSENAIIMGDLAAAEQSHSAWQSLPRDGLADCPACEEDLHIEFLIFADRDAKATKAFGKLLKKNLTCSDVPQRTYGKVIRSQMRLNRSDDARQTCQTGYPLARNNAMFLSQVSEYLLYHVRERDASAGSRMLERHLAWALTTTDASAKLRFCVAVGLLCELLTKQDATCKLRLPREFPLFSDDGVYETAKLHDWFAQQADNLTARFNERNGNDYYTKLMRESQELAKV